MPRSEASQGSAVCKQVPHHSLSGVLLKNTVLYKLWNHSQNYLIESILISMEWWCTPVVEKLGSFGAEIVLSSSWGEAFMRGAAKSPREILKPTRALSERVIMETSKIDAIVADLAAYLAGRAVWAEDEMTQNVQLNNFWPERLDATLLSRYYQGVAGQRRGTPRPMRLLHMN